jgi:hypothetical protein
MWRLIVICVTMLTLASKVDAQMGSFGGRLTAPVFGATPGLSPPEKLSNFSSNQLVAKRHLTPSGSNCISAFASSQTQAINTNIYNHILAFKNDCAQPIRVRACYYNTQDCITVAIPSYKREQKFLGVFPLRDFRFEFREYAN